MLFYATLMRAIVTSKRDFGSLSYTCSPKVAAAEYRTWTPQGNTILQLAARSGRIGRHAQSATPICHGAKINCKPGH
jgi:hypothetical protein